MMEKQKQKDEAYQEYLKEKEQVDRVIQRMIAEDMAAAEAVRQKQSQAKQDMVMSVAEKN